MVHGIGLMPRHTDASVDFVFDEEYTDEEGNDLPDEDSPRLLTSSVAVCLFPH